MAWNAERASKRIKSLMSSVPKPTVQNFDVFLEERRKARKWVDVASESTSIFRVRRGQAVMVDAIHIYFSIQNLDEHRIENGVESERGHARMLEFLHMHYSACDRISEFGAVQRVDFHGGRMHAIVPALTDAGVTSVEVAQAFRFINLYREVAARAAEDLAEEGLQAKFRIGVDAGKCVAIDDGSADESEPVFLGSAANHAAKLAEGDEDGVHVSQRVRDILDLGQAQNSPGGLSHISDMKVSEVANNRGYFSVADIQNGRSMPTADQVMEAWVDERASQTALGKTTNVSFSFYHAPPPLKEIKYSDLMPSKSIRMDLVSLFADIDGYTAFVESAISTGKVPEAVRALYVIRGELQNVLESDFGGRKVRFIGDCIHGVTASGDHLKTNRGESVKKGLQLAGGLESSFRLCKEALEGTERLGLAIGMELGPTPITRLGIRGDRSVRVAASSATSMSEQMQRGIESGVAVGPVAVKVAGPAIHDLIDAHGIGSNRTYNEVVMAFGQEEEVRHEPVYLNTPAIKRSTRAEEDYVPEPVTLRPAAGRAHFG